METNSKHTKNKTVIGSSQSGFTKGNYCLTDLIAVYDKMTSLVDKGRTENVYFDFSKTLVTVSHNAGIDKLLTDGLDKLKMMQTGKWTNCWAERDMFSGTKSRYKPIASAILQGLIPEPVPFHIFISDLDDGMMQVCRRYKIGMSS